MPFSEDTRDLTKSFRTTQDLLKQLLTGLQKRRAAWVSARPSSLEPSPELELLTQAIAREEAVRDELLARIRLVLPRPLGAEPRELHLNVTRIAAALPPTEARAPAPPPRPPRNSRSRCGPRSPSASASCASRRTVNPPCWSPP